MIRPTYVQKRYVFAEKDIPEIITEILKRPALNHIKLKML